jgi:hypothetical protein
MGSEGLAVLDRTRDEHRDGEWTYGIARLADGRFAVVWERDGDPAMAATDDATILDCPVGPQSRGDRTGACLFGSRAEALAYYRDMISALTPTD